MRKTVIQFPRRKLPEIKRPYATHYFTLASDKESSLTQQGAAKTEDNAKRATVVRIILDQWAKATIVDRRSGIVIYTLVRTGRGIDIKLGGREALRRVG